MPIYLFILLSIANHCLLYVISNLHCHPNFSFKQKPRRSLSRYRRSLTRHKLRIASFRSISHKYTDDLFKVGSTCRKKHFSFQLTF